MDVYFHFRKDEILKGSVSRRKPGKDLLGKKICNWEGWDRMGWDEMGRDGMGWGWMGWGGMG